MEHGTVGRAKVNLAVVGVGYWGKNLVRNFYELDALGVICDADKSVEERCRSEYENVTTGSGDAKKRALAGVISAPPANSVSRNAPTTSGTAPSRSSAAGMSHAAGPTVAGALVSET